MLDLQLFGGRSSTGGRSNAPTTRSGSMGNEDVINNIGYAAQTQDQEIAIQTLNDLRSGDTVTLQAKTRRGAEYSTMLTSNGDGSFKLSEVIKSKSYPSRNISAKDAAEEVIYFMSRTNGVRPDVHVKRKNLK